MRNLICGLAMTVAMVLAAAAAASAGPIAGSEARGAAVVGSVLKHVQSRRYCEELRRACQNKDRLGERGLGNCRRYREECGETRASYCAHLRHACLYKEERGEVGEGNCRRYRHECRGEF